MATVVCRLDVSLRDLIGQPGSLEALQAALGERNLTIQARGSELVLTQNSVVVARMEEDGEVTGTYANLLKQIVEETSPLILMAMVAERVRANSLRVKSEQWSVDNKILVMNLEL